MNAIVFRSEDRKVGLVRKSVGKWEVHDAGGVTVTEVDQPQMWQKRTLGEGLTHYRVMDEAVLNGTLITMTTLGGWKEIPAEAIPAGVIEPDWIELALAAGVDTAGLPEVTGPALTEEESKALEEAVEGRLEAEALPNGEMYIPSWVWPPSGNNKGMTDVEWARQLVRSPKIRAFLMEGKPGCGKSLLALLVGGPGAQRMSMSAATDDEGIVGAKNFSLEEGASFDWGPIVLAMQHRHDEGCPDGCGADIVIVDELNLLMEEFATMLHGILEKDSEIFVPGFGLIKAGPGFTMIGTMNEYAGGIPAALKSRLGRPFQRQIQWSVLERIGVDRQVIEVGKMLHQLKDQNDLEDEAPGTRELMAISDYIELVDEASGGYLPKEDAMKFAFDGFGGWDVGPDDRVEIQKAVGAVTGFPPDMRGIGSRGEVQGTLDLGLGSN